YGNYRQKGGIWVTVPPQRAVPWVCVEEQRFEKLMEHFRNEDNNIDFMAYLDNVFDVGALLEDAETKNAALERVEELEENMSHLSEKLQDTENEAMSKIVELEKQLMQRNKDLDSIRVSLHPQSPPPSPPPMVKDRDTVLQRQHNLEKKIQELEKQGTIKIHKKSDRDISILATGTGLPGTGTGGLTLPPGMEVSDDGGGSGSRVQNYTAGGPQHTGHEADFAGRLPHGARAPPSSPASSSSSSPPPLVGRHPSPTAPRQRHAHAVKIKKPIKTKFRMPVFNWVALKPNQINGTVFNEIDDERILEDLNVDDFEEMFKTKAQGQALDVSSSRQKVSQKGPSKVSLLDSNRAKNLAITLRKVGKAPEEICKSIQIFDLRALPVDYVECLMRFLPTEGEVKLMRQFEKERKPLESLTDEDRFMVQFSKIERLMQKMTIMAFIGNFTESVQMLTPQLHAVIAASVSIKSSQKLKKILEIILALGNYMNSGKRGAVYGFKLQNVVKEKYQQVSLFYNELHYVEKAAAVSLDNVLLDVRELQRGMELTRREYSMHGHNTMLKDFIAHSEAKLKDLQDDAKVAKDAFDEVVKFFGENGKTTPPSVFFPVFVRFVKAYRQTEEDNEHRKRQKQILMEKLLEQEAMMEEDQKSPSKSKRQQQELIQELRRKQVKDSRHVYEGKDGAIEDIITDLRNQPYRRADGVRRSGRRCFDDQSLQPINAEVVM
ncbi:hypothetical protein CRUP_010341, partial [Coryphaenoides rupestris]